MSTLIIYYVQTNLMCMAFLLFVLYTYAHETRGLTEAKWFILCIIGTQLYCLSDMIAAIFKNQVFAGARMILWSANGFYIAMPLVLAVLWQRFTTDHTKQYYNRTKKLLVIDSVLSIGAIALIALTVLSAITHFAFTLDEVNGYHRAVGAYIVPVYSYLFMIYETVKMQYISLHSESLQAKRDAKILSLFAIPCIFFSLFQVFYYGITTAQVGFTMGLMVVYLGRQRNKISRDELTGLNNRREYEYAIDRFSRMNGNILVGMVDVDDFKLINDQYGHSEGDEALKTVATILRHACAKSSDVGSFGLYRYGGDEFIILASNFDKEKAEERIQSTIKEEVEYFNSINKVGYQLQLSAGIVISEYEGKDIHKVITSADELMYKIKKSKKKSG